MSPVPFNQRNNKSIKTQDYAKKTPTSILQKKQNKFIRLSTVKLLSCQIVSFKNMASDMVNTPHLFQFLSTFQYKSRTCWKLSANLFFTFLSWQPQKMCCGHQNHKQQVIYLNVSNFLMIYQPNDIPTQDYSALKTFFPKGN